MGLQTFVAEGAGTLSGGPRQRLMIARALVRRPTILLFDEATSALDNETQAIVSRSLERLNVTRIAIAHRLSTIRNADRIYVIQAGRIVQQGVAREHRLLGSTGLGNIRMLGRHLTTGPLGREAATTTSNNVAADEDRHRPPAPGARDPEPVHRAWRRL
jgi:ABC-type multidrug transport system ATPase subunit